MSKKITEIHHSLGTPDSS